MTKPEKNLYQLILEVRKVLEKQINERIYLYNELKKDGKLEKFND